MAVGHPNRGTCSTCRRVKYVRRDGLVGVHVNGAGEYCPGSRRLPEVHTHDCGGCGDAWSETRTAVAVDAVRWPGWLA